MRTAGACVRLAPAAAGAARRLQRLFFLHEGHDLSRFLARALPPGCCMHDQPPCTSDACVVRRGVPHLAHCTAACRASAQAGARPACVHCKGRQAPTS